MSNIKSTIQKYLDSTLGSPKSSYYQLRYNCPNSGCDRGGKYNLEICITPGSTKYLLCHCWSCHYSGHISRLLREYASDISWKLIKEFKTENTKQIKGKENKVLFPEDTIPFYLDEQVTKYLTEDRGMTHAELVKRNVRYCFSKEDIWYNHILFPFYNENHEIIAFCSQNFETKKYKNTGSLNFIPYKEFINPLFPIVITEGIYDALSLPNAIPLLGTNIYQGVLRFIQDKKLILALDNNEEVSIKFKKDFIKKLYTYGAKIVTIFDSDPYKDPNDFWLKNRIEMKIKLQVLFELLNNAK